MLNLSSLMGLFLDYFVNIYNYFIANNAETRVNPAGENRNSKGRVQPERRDRGEEFQDYYGLLEGPQRKPN